MLPFRRIGIDIGGVIVDSDTDGGESGEETMFGALYLSTPEMPGAIDTIARLSATEGVEGIWVVSKCGPRVQQRSLEWLESRRFSERTGIGVDRIRFCRKRNQKAPIAQELGLTTFVDDRVEILDSMPPGMELLAFRARDVQVDRAPAGIVPVDSWGAVLAALTR